MSRRRKADSAEALVKGIGTIMLLFGLLAVSTLGTATGQNPAALLAGMIQTLFVIAILTMLFCVVGLVVWKLINSSSDRQPPQALPKDEPPVPPEWIPDLHGTPPRRRSPSTKR